MQLSQLEYLQAVANYGGVRKAARAVHVSPQAVSSAIKKLESEYQIVLLNRSAGEAVLSPAGREFARRARVILAQVDDLKKLAFRMRPSHLRNQGTVSFLRNTWVKRSSRFFHAQQVINLLTL